MQYTVHSEPMKHHHPGFCSAVRRTALHLNEGLSSHLYRPEEEQTVVAAGFHGQPLAVLVVVFALAVVDWLVVADSPSGCGEPVGEVFVA